MVYNCDILELSKALENNDETLLSINRKMTSLKNEEFDMSKIYVCTFHKEDFDKLNYIYTFFLYEYPTNFDMDKYKKFFYLNLKKKTDIEDLLKLSFTDFTDKLNKVGVGISYFENEDQYNEFVTHMNEYMKTNDDTYEIGLEALRKTILIWLVKIKLHTGQMEEKMKILKKKSSDKIDKTLWNRFFHLTLYGEWDNTYNL